MSATDSAFVREVLTDYGQRVRKGMEPYLRGPGLAGEFGTLVGDYPSRAGRSLRASLCLAAARAFRASPEDAIDSAIALELLHNAFLVHDDVEDGSEERRGRPTLHVLHGVPAAINVGDGLAIASLRPLLQNRSSLGPRVAFQILTEAQRMARESVEGQALELRWRDENETSLEVEDYLRMALKKTCWYTAIYPCRVGAIIGTRAPIAWDRFVRFGFLLGASFQIQDDVLNLKGDHAAYGKELGGDIREGKRTLALIHLLRALDGDERARLKALLARPLGGREESDVAWVLTRMERAGSIEFARRTANELAGAAAFEFDLAFAEAAPSRDRDFIEALPRWILERA